MKILAALLVAVVVVVVVVVVVPATSLADAYDVRILVGEETRECSGERSSDAYSYEYGDNGTSSAEWTSYDERCDVRTETASVRLERDGETLAAVGAGERFEGRSVGWDDESSWQNDTDQGSWSSQYDHHEGNWSKGVYAEAAGEQVQADRSRCEGQRGDGSGHYETTNVSYEHNSTWHSETCRSGVFLSAADHDEGVELGGCNGWGYDAHSRDGAAPEGVTNETYDYRSCSASQRADVAGAGVTLVYWEGHYKDCSGSWNGTAHETRCASWGGEWSAIVVEVRRPDGWPHRHRVVLPMELGLLS